MNQVTASLPRSGMAPLPVPALIAARGEHTARRFIEFFVATIRNRNTRVAYYRAVSAFCRWCEQHGIGDLLAVEPITVATYIEQLGLTSSPPTVKQHLAAVRGLFDWLVTGAQLPSNPAASVRGPRHSVKRGKTPVLTADDTRRLASWITRTCSASSAWRQSRREGPRDRAW